MSSRDSMSASERRDHLCLSIFGRCGAIFFHSLFDGHPGLSTIPGIAPYYVLADWALGRVPVKNLSQCVAWLTQRFCGVFNDPYLRRDAGLDKLGENADEPAYVNPAQFHAYVGQALARYQRIGLIEISEVMHDAFDSVCGFPRRDRIFLQLHTISPGASGPILKALPARHQLFLVRDPVENIESCVNYLMATTLVTDSRLTKFYTILRGLLEFQEGPTFLGDRAVAVRFEDVKKQPEPFLRQICETVELPFDPSLLSSKVMGKKFHTPPTKRNPGIQGFSAQTSAPQGYRLSADDRAFFGTLMRGVSEFMNYEVAARLTPADMAGRARYPLDVEVAFAEAIGFAPQTLPQRSDYIEFRKTLAKCLEKPDPFASGLACRRLFPGQVAA